MGQNRVLDPALCGRSVPDLAPEIYVIFHFLHQLSGYDNILETE